MYTLDKVDITAGEVGVTKVSIVSQCSWKRQMKNLHVSPTHLAYMKDKVVLSRSTPLAWLNLLILNLIAIVELTQLI